MASAKLFRPRRYEQAIDRRTKIVPLTQVSFVTGHRSDVPAITRIAHANGALVFLDGYQDCGTRPIDVKALDVDFFVTGTLKYLLGPPGLAFLYVRRELIETLSPTMTSWFSQREIFAFDTKHLDLAPAARRFENGAPPIPSLYLARPALDLLSVLGLANVAAQIERLTKAFLAGVARLGIATKTPADSVGPSGRPAINEPARGTGKTHRPRDRRVDQTRRGTVRVPRLQHARRRRDGLAALEDMRDLMVRVMKVLAGGCRVYGAEEGAVTSRGNWTSRTVMSRSTGAPLITQTINDYRSGISAATVNPTGEEVHYVAAGTGVCYVDGYRYNVQAGCGAVRAAGIGLLGRESRTRCAPDHQRVLSRGCGAPRALDAPPAGRGGTAPRLMVQEAERDPIRAGRDRVFRLLVNTDVGCKQVTQFIGWIPASKAPFHRHMYEEGICILEGRAFCTSRASRRRQSSGPAAGCTSPSASCTASRTPGRIRSGCWVCFTHRAARRRRI